jgi:hypothetical protein
MLKKCFCMMTHYFEIDIVTYEDKTIDSYLPPLQAVARMYNEGSKYDASMATGFALLSIDKEGGTPSTL